MGYLVGRNHVDLQLLRMPKRQVIDAADAGLDHQLDVFIRNSIQAMQICQLDQPVEQTAADAKLCSQLLLVLRSLASVEQILAAPDAKFGEFESLVIAYNPELG